MKDPFEQVHEFVEALLGQRRPKHFRVETPEDWAALKMAARLAVEKDPRQGEPDPEFIAKMRQELLKQVPRPGEDATSRRRLLVAALAGLAAGLSGGIGLDRVFGRSDAPSPSPPPSIPLVRDNGRWFLVAKLSELPKDSALRFAAGSLEGHLIKRGHDVLAISAICSHMPCTLLWQEQEGHFLCPCHDVTFYPDGELKFARRPYPPLTRFQTKIDGDNILVWSIGEDRPRQEGSPL